MDENGSCKMLPERVP